MDTKKLRQKILDLAIRGKLVPQDPNDEPASVLLERIRAEKERLIKKGKIKRSKKSASDDEIEAPFEIPESWIACKLEDIAYIGTGATPDTRNNDYYNGIIPWVSSSCTKYDYIDTPTSYITQKAIDETNCRVYPKGTLIMAMYGEGKTRGQISELKIDAATNQACAAIVPYNISTPQYIKLYLKRSYLHIREQAEGGTQPNLNLSKIAQYDISLPPLSEQKRIVNAVERWFTIIDELESNEGDLLKAIDKAKSKILDLAIHGKLVPQDPNDEPAIELLKRINPKYEPFDNALYENIPHGWEVCTINDIASSELGKTLDKEKNKGEYKPYLCSINVFWNQFNLTEMKQMRFEDSELEHYSIKQGDLVICEGGDAGRCAVWPYSHTALFQNAIHRVRFKEDIVPYFYMYVIMYLKNKHILENYCKGVTIKHFTKTALLLLPVPLPPIKEQLRIVSKIKELFAVLDEIKESLEN